jgi:hypothetical protein
MIVAVIGGELTGQVLDMNRSQRPRAAAAASGIFAQSGIRASGFRILRT